MSLGSNLQELRKAKGWKQETLAEVAGVSLTQISKIERNETDPRASTVVKLAQALDCSVDKLMLGRVSGGLNGVLKDALERAKLLRPRDKAELVSVIHKYCTASVLMREVAHSYEAVQSGEMDIDEALHLERQDREQQKIEEYLDERDRAELDELIKQEELEEALEQRQQG